MKVPDWLLRLLDTVMDWRIARRHGERPHQQPPAPCLIRAFPNCAHRDCSCADIR